MPYQTIPDSEFTEGQPARGITMIAMRDNLVAVAGGESGAPKIQTAGIQDQAITNDKINDSLKALYAVGTYTFSRASGLNIFTYAPGASVPGSRIGSGVPGTWRNMSPLNYSASEDDGTWTYSECLFLRIS